MPATVSANPREQIVDALRFCRDARHHTECRCYSWRDNSGAAFCTPQEALWSKALSRLIDDCRGR